MDYSYEQIGNVCATFICEDGLEVGNVCLVKENSTVSPCDDDEAFVGAVVSKRDGCAAVTVQGFVTVSYTGSAPVFGYCPLAADGLGGVMFSAGSHEYLVVQVDTTAKTVTFLL